MTHDPTQIERLYKSMLLIREIEEHIRKVYHTDAVKSPVHLSIGQESVAVGVCDALSPDDVVSHTYRCHATYVAKGGDVNRMMAELYGKKDGCAGGKAGSMHLIDMDHGIMGASAVVGTTLPVATGYALALQRFAKKSGQRRLVVAFFGDGATEEGSFYESLNYASLAQLPIIYLCENNRLAIHTPIEKRWATERLGERVETFGIPTHRIKDGDVFKIRDAISDAADKIRAGTSGPVFIECDTYRWMEHVGPADDHSHPYRDNKEYEFWKANDQIARLASLMPADRVNHIKEEVASEIFAAVAFAEKSPFPGIEELYTHVYAD